MLIDTGAVTHLSKSILDISIGSVDEGRIVATDSVKSCWKSTKRRKSMLLPLLCLN